MWLMAAAANGGTETATKSPATPPSMQREKTEEISATVANVDPATRTIQLQGKDGKTGSFVAGPEVKNFAQIHKGDKVVVSYYQGISAQVLPPGAAASKEVNQ